MSHHLRALLQPAPLLSLAIIAVFWIGLVFLVPDASGTLADYERHRTVYFAAAAVLTLLELITVAAGIRRQLSLEKTNLRFTTALENMTHGLCMFDGSKRLVICNERYASLYRLPPELLKAGTSHEAIIANRVMNGLLKGEKNAGAVDKKPGALGKHSAEKVSSRIDELADGRLIRVVRQPMPDGGWVATHEDITERQRLEAQRDTMLAQENRRLATESAISSFRKRVEDVLGIVSNSTDAMKSTANALIGSSHETTQHAEGALRESNDAAANVTLVAGSAEELSASIAELNQQLAQTTELVGNAVRNARRPTASMPGCNRRRRRSATRRADPQHRGPDQPLALNATIEAARPAKQGAARRRCPRSNAGGGNRQGDRRDRASHPGGAGIDRGAVAAVHGIEESMNEISTQRPAPASILQQSAATSRFRNAVNAASGTSLVVPALGNLGSRHWNRAAWNRADRVAVGRYSVGNLRAETQFQQGRGLRPIYRRGSALSAAGVH